MCGYAVNAVFSQCCYDGVVGDLSDSVATLRGGDVVIVDAY